MSLIDPGPPPRQPRRDWGISPVTAWLVAWLAPLMAAAFTLTGAAGLARGAPLSKAWVAFAAVPCILLVGWLLGFVTRAQQELWRHGLATPALLTSVEENLPRHVLSRTVSYRYWAEGKAQEGQCQSTAEPGELPGPGQVITVLHHPERPELSAPVNLPGYSLARVVASNRRRRFD